MLRFRWLHAVQEDPTFRFTLPVMLENILSIFISMLFSQVISGISASALAAIGMANTVMNVVFALFSVMTTGTAVLVSHQIGARSGQEAAETIEQSISISALSSVAMALLCILIAPQLLQLLMPSAEPALFQEAVRYYRILMVSLPFHVLIGVLSGAMRALGNSRMPMVMGTITNVLLLAFGYLFMVLIPLDEIGAGLAYICCRLIGAGLMLHALLRDHRYFVLRLRNLMHVHFSTILRILRIGIPVSIESVFVQFGYMLANSMSIALGTLESGVYQIMNTLNGFIGLPQGICSTVALSAVGRLLGAKAFKTAKKTGRLIWLAGILSSIILGLIVVLFGHPLSALYSSDPNAIAMSARLMWILVVMDIAGCSINAIDAQLRAGGDVKYVMVVTLTAVWLIRLPLTYLFCFVLDLGVLGIYGANTISLYYRAILGFVRHCGTKWMTKKV